jgi:hypothetical protein
LAATFRLHAALVLTTISLALLACDPDGKKDCAWVLEPEVKLEGTTEPGFIPVCARNRKSMKENCAMQATLDYAKQAYGRTFRYVDIRFISAGQLQTVSSIKFCNGKN